MIIQQTKKKKQSNDNSKAIACSLLALSFVFSFPFCQPKGSTALKKIYSDVLVGHSELSFTQGSVHILENMSMGFDSAVVFFFRSPYLSNDSIIKSQTSTLENLADVQTERKKMLNADKYIKSIENYEFEYDTVPSVASKSSYYLSTKTKILYNYRVQLEKDLDDTLIKLSIHTDTHADSITFPRRSFFESNFILYDLDKDKVPEIFVFTKEHLSGRILYDMDVYKLVNETKKGF